jgi:hypothetical protein
MEEVEKLDVFTNCGLSFLWAKSLMVLLNLAINLF